MLKQHYLSNLFWLSLTASLFAAHPSVADTVTLGTGQSLTSTTTSSWPNYLNPNPNPLQLPTQSKEVRIQGTQPISLQQALGLARRNSWSLQAGERAIERSRAAVRQQQAAEFPTLGVRTGVTHFVSH